MVCRCQPGVCGLDFPVRLMDSQMDQIDLLPFGDYLPYGRLEWEQMPLRIKQILSRCMLQVWKTLFQERVGGLQLPEGLDHNAMDAQERFDFVQMICYTKEYLEWNYEHDFCCGQVDDMFLTRDFEKVVVERQILSLESELKTLKAQTRRRRELANLK